MAPAIAPRRFAPPAAISVSSTSGPSLIRPRQTARPSASSRPPCANGPTLSLPNLGSPRRCVADLATPDNTRQMSFGGPGRNHALIEPLSRSSSTAGTSMAINLTRGDTRPILMGLAIAAVLGWGLFIYAELYGAAQNQKA